MDRHFSHRIFASTIYIKTQLMQKDHQESMPVLVGLLLGILLGIQQSNLDLYLSLGILFGTVIQYTINHLPQRKKINNEH